MDKDLKIFIKKVNFLIDNHNENNFYNLRNDLVNFLFENQNLCFLFEKIILNKSIDKYWLKKIVSLYIIEKTLYLQTKTDTIKPLKTKTTASILPFINKKTDKETRFLFENNDCIISVARLYKDERKRGLPISVKLNEAIETLISSYGLKDKEYLFNVFVDGIVDGIKIKEIEEEIFHIKKLSNDLEIEAEGFKNSTPDNQKDDYLFFDAEASKLIYNKVEIKITKGKDIYYIIKYIFEREDIYEDCFYDELIDTSELETEKYKKKDQRTGKYVYKDKSIYDALIQFNKRIINKGINDLFNISFRSVKINHKYKLATR